MDIDETPKPRWRAEAMAALAARWIAELRSGAEPRDGDAGAAVTFMNFFAPADVQWAFLQAAVELAETEEEFCAIAAGPFEHLLGHHGDAYIDAVERLCAQEPKWQRVAEGSWRYMMSDAVWARVQAIQARGRASSPDAEADRGTPG